MRVPHFAYRRFAGDERGGVAVLFGLTCVVLLMVIGIAIDTARYQDLSTRTQAALDGAALAAAKLLEDENISTGEIQERARAYFNTAIPTFGADPNAISSLDVVVDKVEHSVETKINMKLPTFFGRIAHVGPATTFNRSSKVVYDMSKLEISLVLDVTGSMNDKNKIGDMRQAAQDIIDELMDNSISEDGVRIAVAPYAASVNAGSLASAVSSVPSTTVCTGYMFMQTCTTVAGVDQDTCVIERTGAEAATDAAPTGANMLPNVPASPSPYGKYSCPAATVVPLKSKSDKDQIKATIAGYMAGGSTAGHIGTAWGWYLLSENWASILGDSAPKPLSTSKLRKIMIVMTDGMFNTSYLSGPATPDPQQTTESYDQFQALCTGAKAGGIEIFTIGYDLSDATPAGATALAQLEQCASSSSNFYDAAAGNLSKTFKDIAQKLNELRVSG